VPDLGQKDILENWFECRGFDPDWISVSQDAWRNCAPVIEEYLARKAGLASKCIGGLSGGFLGIALILLFLAYKFKTKDAVVGKSELMRFHSRNDGSEDEVNMNLNSSQESIDG
jgi:hypothetical protein